MASFSHGNTGAPQRLRILTLDGGGIKGLLSLFLLQDLMQRVAVKTHDQFARPCDYFELIIGTGTGGVSALFLGRMRMTMDAAIKAYIRVAVGSFKPSQPRILRRLLKEKALLQSDAITSIMCEIVQNSLGDRDACLQEPSGRSGATFCRTAVLAASTSNASDPPYVFRSYPTSLPASTFATHEVARATVSTAGLFPPVSLGTPSMKFVGAGISGYNNPAEIALQEAAHIWPNLEVSCLVSLGTGLQEIVNIDRRWLKLTEISRRLVEDCERVHYSRFRRRHIEGLPYFRFNVTRGLEETRVQEWDGSGAFSPLAGITDGYTRQPDVDISLNECVDVLFGNIHDTFDEGKTIKMPECSNYLPLLNPPPEIFHGRNVYMEVAVSTILCGAPARLAIRGPGGIGKTSIALHILHDSRIRTKFGDHRRFISCEGVASIPALANVFCVAFDIHGVSDQYKGLLSVLALRYQTEPLFVVLDNFETIWDVAHGRHETERFLATLVTIPKLTLVITMRGSELPASLRWTLPLLPVVEPLPVEAARATFLENGAQEDRHLDALLWTVDCVPLAVTLMARLGQNSRPLQLLQRWNEEQVRLLSRPRDEGRLENMEVSILFSLNSNRLLSAPGALSLLSGLSFLPSGVFEDDLPYIFPRLPDLKFMTTTLIEVGLAYYDKSRTLRVLSPIWSYMMHSKSPQHNSTLFEDLESYFWELLKLERLSPGKEGYTDAVKTLSRAAPNIEAVLLKALIEEADHNRDKIIEAALNWTKFLIWNRPQMLIIELATELTRRLPECRSYTARCLFFLGRTQRMIRANEETIKIFMEAQVLFKTAGNMHKVADCLWEIGEIQRVLEDYNSAEKTLHAALSTFESIGYGGGSADCLWSLGEIKRTFNNLDDAREMFTRSQKLYEDGGFKRGHGDCLWSLGEIERKLGEYETSRATMTKALETFDGLGMRKRMADCHWILGLIHCSTSDYEAASTMFTKARDGYKEVGEMENAAYCEHSLEIIS